MTIQKLAYDYKQQCQYYNENETIDVTFEAGANAVIREIEKITALWPKEPAIRAVERKIKELKGEL